MKSILTEGEQELASVAADEDEQSSRMPPNYGGAQEPDRLGNMIIYEACGLEY